MAANVIWGIILILLGISLLAKSMLRITIPIIRILLAAFLIYAGVSVFTEDGRKNNHKSVAIRQQSTIINQLKPQYGILIGDKSIDLSNLDLNEPFLTTINAFVGRGTITLPATLPVKVILNAAFGQVSFPDNHTIFAGAYTYQSSDEEPILTFHIKLVVGSLEIVASNEEHSKEKRLQIT